ncbi:MAG: hypothetical protein ABIE22_05630 [archaeon]
MQKRGYLIIGLIIVLLAFILVATYSLKNNRVFFSPTNESENVTQEELLNDTGDDDLGLLVIGDTCIEDDSGDNNATAGTVTWNSTDFDDVCNNSYLLTEYYCDSQNNSIAKEYTCLKGCSNGACNTNSICLDGDGGKNYTQKTTTSGRNESNPNQEISGEDFCSSNNLVEYYCENDFLKSESHPCVSCTEGICTESSSCTPSWTTRNTTCNSDERYTVYYTDSNSCNETPQANTTGKCDFDSNGVIGNFDSFETTRISLEVYINGSLGNSSKIFSGKQKIEFRESNTVRVEFNWDFSSTLDIDSIFIEKQSSAAEKGYLLIDNLDINKTVRVDKLKTNSNSVCIKDSGVNSSSEISANCTASDETKLNCPGSSGRYNCVVEGSFFKVSGVSHSLVMEFGEGSALNCSEDWDCTSWGTCTNNQQARDCIDLNSCSVNNMRIETQACISCTPSWDCDAWEPERCPKDKIQTRTCTDANACSSDTTRTETQDCEYKGKAGLITLIVIIALLALIIIFSILYLLKKQKEDSPSSSFSSTLSNKKPPFSPPMQPSLQRPAQSQQQY